MHQASVAGGYSSHMKGLPTPDDVSSWYVQRACEIDASSGQIQLSILLLEAAMQRGVSSDELVSLLMQAKALSKLLNSSDASPLSNGTWEMSLDRFCCLEAHEQLLLLLSRGDESGSAMDDAEDESGEEDYDVEWIERVINDKWIESDAKGLSLAIKEHGHPFLSSIPGLAHNTSLLLNFLNAQLSRPSWFRTLVWAEARRISDMTDEGLFSSSLDLARTVESCIRGSEVHGSTNYLMQSLGCCLWALSQNHDPDESIKALIALLKARKVMERRGVPVCFLSPSALSSGSRATSEQILDALLLDSSIVSWKERDWRLLWADIDLLCSHGALPGVSAQDAFSDMLRRVLDCGQTSVAASLISASHQTGGKSLMDGALVRPPKLHEDGLVGIIADTASRLLFSAPSLDDQDTTSAAELLSLLPEHALASARSLPPALRLLKALPWIRKLLTSLPLPQGNCDLLPARLVEEIDKGGAKSLVKRLLDVFSLVPEANLHRQVDELVEIALSIGSSQASSAEEETRSSILLLAANAATSVGDLKAGLSLTLMLASLRYPPAATLAATLGMEHQERGADQGTRFKLLSFAASNCDTNALPQLLEELAVAGKSRIESNGLSSDSVVDPSSPSALLVYSLASHECVPSSGWWTMLVITILNAPTANEAAALVQSALTDISYSETQRLVFAGACAHSLRALFCLLPSSTFEERRLLTCLSHADLLSRAKMALSSSSIETCPKQLKEEAEICLQAADALLAHLKGVEDGRNVRLSLEPSTNQPESAAASTASAFVSGDKASIRAAVLQQARSAGQRSISELEGNGEAAASIKLLDNSTALGLSYDAAEEVECRSEFLLSAIKACQHSAGPLPAQMRSLVLGQVEIILATQSSQAKSAALLAYMMAADLWTQIPPSSHHHISTLLLSLSKCASSLSSLDNTLTSLIEKVVSLTDKALGSGSLKGLDSKSLLTPLLRPPISSFLSPLVISHLQGSLNLKSDTTGLISLGDDKDEALQSLSVDAQAAVFSFATSPSSAASASKLIKALQTLLPPSRATSALPPSLPHLCLLLHVTTSNDPNGETIPIYFCSSS
jgi:hypothetical protein